MNKHIIRKELINVIKHQVLPALGCTEPVSLALAAATAAAQLDNHSITKIEAFVSPNLMKNGMGVTVPGTGMVGLPIAAAIGAIGGAPNAGLEVLKNITTEQIDLAKKMLEDNRVSVKIAPQNNKSIYAQATVYSDNDQVKVVIEDSHTNVVLIKKWGNHFPKKSARTG